MAAGFTDAWAATRSDDPGYTCCNAEDLLNPTPTYTDRIDYVFSRGAVRPFAALRVGVLPLERISTGQWPSDHAGVYAPRSSSDEPNRIFSCTVAASMQLLAERAGGHDEMRRALHVTNGDSAAGTLLQTALVERVVPWRDALHDGPVPAVGDDELRRLRATFLADGVPSEASRIERWLEERDRTLAHNADRDFVLWFEADLYDQLQLVQVLVRLGELDVDAGRITLISIGEHLGIAHFAGLGQLDAGQLERVAAAAAAPVSAAALDLARDAWTAFSSDDPRGLTRIAKVHHPELRYLAEAFDRLSREYPSTRDGLSLTERRILAAINDGAATAGAVFVQLGSRESRQFLGDVFCFRIVERLATARTPLLHAAVPVSVSTVVRLTGAGERILAGADDHVRLNGVDRWIGGVHLVGDETRWRWNEGTEAVVATALASR